MIRDIKKEDRHLWLELTGEFYSSPAVDHSIPESYRNRTFDELLSHSPYAKGAIVELDGEAVGYVLLAITFSQEAGGKAVWIEEAYIREAFRSKGLGQEIFSWVEGEFPDAARFRLEVEDDNVRAIKLYEKLGYKPLPYGQMIKDML
jgi:ribosomal protein S18 acetylase RimI-like enzyme